MKLGIINQNENYLSLSYLNHSIIKAVKNIYKLQTHTISLDINTNDIKQINKIYQTCDIVLNLTSKSRNFKVKYPKPTIYLGHAWMDHGAGINLYQNNKYFNNYDCISFASLAAQKKYKYIYKQGIDSYHLPYFTNENIPKLNPKQIDEILNKYKIPSKKKILIYYGRLNQEKNIHGLINLFSQINNKSLILVIIGNFSDEKTYGFGDNTINDKQYQKKIQNLIKQNKGIFMIQGIPRGDLLKFLSIAYIALNLSLCFEEDFGISAVEALKAGIPLITTKRGGLKEIGVHKQTGFHIKTHIQDSFNPQININNGIIEFINKLIKNKIFYNNISANCKNRYHKHYSKQAFLNNLEKIINQVYNNSKIINIQNNEPFNPPKWIKEIYDNCHKTNNTYRIYLDNIKLFNELYKFYT